MTTEGIKLSKELIENIRWYRENPGALATELRVIDKAIARIAGEADGLTPDEAAESRRVVAGLCHLKEILASLESEG